MSTAIQSWTRSVLGRIGKNVVIFFYRIFIKLVNSEDMHNFSDKFDFGTVLTIDMGVTCP